MKPHAARAVAWCAIVAILAGSLAVSARMLVRGFDWSLGIPLLVAWWILLAGSACAAAAVEGRWRWIMWPGVVGACATLALIFLDYRDNWMSAPWFAVAGLGHIAVLLLIDVRRRPARIVRLIAMAAAVVMAGIAMSEWMNWGNPSCSSYPTVVLVWAMLCMPLLLWLESLDAETKTHGQPLAGLCPRCGRDQTLRLGISTCANCGLRVRIHTRTVV